MMRLSALILAVIGFAGCPNARGLGDAGRNDERGDLLAEAADFLRAGRIRDTHRTGLVDDEHDLHREPIGARAIGADPAGQREAVVDVVRLDGLGLDDALDLAFDYQWTNKNLFYDLYTRTESYFENSDMKAEGSHRPTN